MQVLLNSPKFNDSKRKKGPKLRLQISPDPLSNKHSRNLKKNKTSLTNSLSTTIQNTNYTTDKISFRSSIKHKTQLEVSNLLNTIDFSTNQVSTISSIASPQKIRKRFSSILPIINEKTKEGNSVTEKELMLKFKKTKIKEKDIPMVCTKQAMNNLLIRDSRFNSDPIEEIIRSKYHQRIFEEFTAKREKMIRDRIEEDNKRFDKIKRHLPIEEILKLKKKENKEDSFRTIEEEYEEVKTEYNTNCEKRRKEQSKILADLILNMSKGENIEEFRNTAEVGSEPLVMRENLMNSVYLKKIMKKRQLSMDEEIDLSDAEKLKNQIRSTRLDMIKVLREKDKPIFLKESFNKTTNVKYKGIQGKYFGVAC